MSSDTVGRPTDNVAADTAASPEPKTLIERYARRGLDSGAIAGVVGAGLTLRGLGSLRRGDWGRATIELFVGAVLVAVARGQRAESSSLGSGPDEETTSAHSSTVPDSREEADERATAESDVTSRDAPKYADEVETGTTGETEYHGPSPADATYEPLGEAAFDEHANEVPAPQRAFDREFLTLDSELAWGIHEADDLVLLSTDYDAVADRPGVRYVASSHVDDDRTISVPGPVLTHWEQRADAGVGVAGGDDLVFATADALATDHLLVVVPAAWRDDLDWASEG